MKLIELKNITKIYTISKEKESQKVLALDNINLTISSEEFVAIVGPSGSGKSTLMQIMALLDNPSSGEYLFLGKNVSTYTEDELSLLRRNTIGFVFQFFNLLPRTSCLDNVHLPLLYSRSSNIKKAKDLLEQVGLSERLDYEPSQLSGGQQQRVAIARALINDPKIIFADEPTGNINSQQSDEVIQNLKKLNHTGVTVVLVTHDPKVAECAKRIIRIEDGKITSDTINENFVPYKAKEFFYSVDTMANVDEKLKKEVSSKDLKGKLKKYFKFSFVKENLKIALKSLSINKLRTFLSTIGISIGIAATMSMVSIGEGAKKSIQENLEKFGSNVIDVGRSWKKSNNKKAVSRSLSLITPRDLKTIEKLKLRGVPIESVSPEIRIRSSVANFGANNTQIDSMVAVLPSYFDIRSYEISRGRIFSEEEEQRKEKVCVIGTSVYKNLFQVGDNPVGKEIKISGHIFKIVGVLKPKGSDGRWDQDNIVIIPLSTGLARLVRRTNYNSITIKAKSVDDTFIVRDLVEEELKKIRKISEEDDFPLSIRNSTEMKDMILKSANTMGLLLGCIAFISLIVGGVNIMNIMLVSVKERIKEIGLRKALGAQRKDILYQFIAEATFIGGIGGFIGIILGIIISNVISHFLGWYAPFSLFLSLIAFIFSFLLAICFGFLPAKQASELSPIEALRSE